MPKTPSLDASAHRRAVEQYASGMQIADLAAEFGLAESYAYSVCRGDAPAYRELWDALPHELRHSAAGTRRGAITATTAVEMCDAYGNEGLTVRDIAARFSVTPSAVHAQLTRTDLDITSELADKVNDRRDRHSSGLSSDDGQAIASSYAAGALQAELAQRYGTSQMTISRVLRGVGRWAPVRAALDESTREAVDLRLLPARVTRVALDDDEALVMIAAYLREPWEPAATIALRAGIDPTTLSHIVAGRGRYHAMVERLSPTDRARLDARRTRQRQRQRPS